MGVLKDDEEQPPPLPLSSPPPLEQHEAVDQNRKEDLLDGEGTPSEPKEEPASVCRPREGSSTTLSSGASRRSLVGKLSAAEQPLYQHYILEEDRRRRVSSSTVCVRM